MEFEEPPLVERNELPTTLQPQNRFLGKMRSYLNGMSPYPDNTPLKEEEKAIGNQSDEKMIEMKEALHNKNVNLVDVNLENNN